MATSGLVTLAAATMNVAELVLAHEDLDAGATGFALLVSAYGFGLVGGALYAGRDGGDVRRRRFARARRCWPRACWPPRSRPTLWLALLTFVVTGTANGLFSTSNRIAAARARSPSASTAAPSASSTRSTPGASRSRCSPAARSPPPSAAARPSRSPARLLVARRGRQPKGSDRFALARARRAPARARGARLDEPTGPDRLGAL